MKIKALLISRLAITALTLLSLTSCGGGGGGGSAGAAFVSISAEPGTIDTGDRIVVSIYVSEINDNGIALKIRFPTELTFVESSAEISADGDERGYVPDVTTTSEKESYLVFYVDADDFGEDGEGTLSLELQGRESIDAAAIEVDPDVDDPLVDNTIEFNVDEPQFEAEGQTYVRVKG